MPDDDALIGQGIINERNEARNPLKAVPLIFACRNPEQAWIDEQRERAEVVADIEQGQKTLARLLQTPALPGNEDRRLWAISTAMEELGRLERLLETLP